jgi:NhaP-type Na+/H+ or K+/H+ antiporter
VDVPSVVGEDGVVEAVIAISIQTEITMRQSLTPPRTQIIPTTTTTTITTIIMTILMVLMKIMGMLRKII